MYGVILLCFSYLLLTITRCQYDSPLHSRHN